MLTYSYRGMLGVFLISTRSSSLICGFSANAELRLERDSLDACYPRRVSIFSGLTVGFAGLHWMSTSIHSSLKTINLTLKGSGWFVPTKTTVKDTQTFLQQPTTHDQKGATECNRLNQCWNIWQKTDEQIKLGQAIHVRIEITRLEWNYSLFRDTELRVARG